MREDGHRYVHTVPDLPWKAKPVPPCRNHPDRLGISHYGNPYSHSLCRECLDERLAALGTLALDLHGARMGAADLSAVRQRDG